jgi:hypothetical protein
MLPDAVTAAPTTTTSSTPARPPGPGLAGGKPDGPGCCLPVSTGLGCTASAEIWCGRLCRRPTSCGAAAGGAEGLAWVGLVGPDWRPCREGEVDPRRPRLAREKAPPLPAAPDLLARSRGRGRGASHAQTRPSLVTVAMSRDASLTLTAPPACGCYPRARQAPGPAAAQTPGAWSHPHCCRQNPCSSWEPAAGRLVPCLASTARRARRAGSRARAWSRAARAAAGAPSRSTRRTARLLVVAWHGDNPEASSCLQS